MVTTTELTINDVDENTPDCDVAKLYCQSIIANLATNFNLPLGDNRCLFDFAGNILDIIDICTNSDKTLLKLYSIAIYEFIINYNH